MSDNNTVEGSKPLDVVAEGERADRALDADTAADAKAASDGKAADAKAASDAKAADAKAADAKTLRKMSRSELIDVIHDMQQVPVDPEAAPDKEVVDEERARLKQRKLFFRTFRTTIYAMLVVAAVAVLIATLLMPVLQVSGTSMEPTLEDGDIVVLSKIGDFETGDLCGLYWQNKLLIKRIIATPGDIVDIDSHGVVSVNGQVLDEPYVDELSLGQCDITLPYQVPENRYFVMGDHRETSIDSRTSAIGCIEKDQVVGKILFRVYPLDSIALVR